MKSERQIVVSLLPEISGDLFMPTEQRENKMKVKMTNWYIQQEEISRSNIL